MLPSNAGPRPGNAWPRNGGISMALEHTSRTSRRNAGKPATRTTVSSSAFRRMAWNTKQREVPLDEPPPLPPNSELMYIGKPTRALRRAGEGHGQRQIHGGRAICPACFTRAWWMRRFPTAASSPSTPAQPKSCPAFARCMSSSMSTASRSCAIPSRKLLPAIR